MKYPNFILVFILSVMTSCIKDSMSDSGEDIVKTGDALPEFAVEMNDGNVISTEDVKGKVSVIAFFHTLCPDCRAELPVLQNVYEKYSGDERVMVFAVSREESDDDVSEYWNGNGFSIPFSAQEDRTVYEMFSTMGIPKIYISDRKTVVRYVHSDVDMPEEKVLTDEINGLINE